MRQKPFDLIHSKTQVRFNSNASAFYFKRKYILSKTSKRFTPNASAFLGEL